MAGRQQLERPPHSNAAAKTPQPIHTSPGPAQNTHTPTQPTADATTQPKPRSNSHYEKRPMDEATKVGYDR